MAVGHFVSYLRVATARQERSGSALKAQREEVRSYLTGCDGAMLREFVEIEDGRRGERPELAAALAESRLAGATLLVARLGHLAGNARFLLSLVEGIGEGGVVFCNLPRVPSGVTGKSIAQRLAAVAEREAGLSADHAKAALATVMARTAARSSPRGAPPLDWRASVLARQERARVYAAIIGPLLVAMRERGLSLRECVAELVAHGVQAPVNGAWTVGLVTQLLTPVRLKEVR